METVTVRKDELRQIIEKNKAKHRAIFEKAAEGWRTQMFGQVNLYLEKLKAGKVAPASFYLPVPQDHTKDYDRILSMLDMHVEDSVVISQQDFARYAMDDWDWKREFITSSNAYLATKIDEEETDIPLTAARPTIRKAPKAKRRAR